MHVKNGNISTILYLYFSFFGALDSVFKENKLPIFHEHNFRHINCRKEGNTKRKFSRSNPVI